MSKIDSEQSLDRATSSDNLTQRLEVNKAYSSTDFHDWLMQRLEVKAGEDVLDVGCGVGAQTLRIAKQVRPGGSVSSVDLSKDAIDALKGNLVPDSPVQAIAGDMADLQRLIDHEFTVKRYDLAQSTYALYYADAPLHVLAAMKRGLQPGGRMVVFVPNLPHGLVDLAARYSTVPDQVYASLRFGPEVLEPWFEANFSSVSIDHFHNVVTVPTADELVRYYRATTYYSADAEPQLRAEIEAEIETAGVFSYEKNGFLIRGTDGQ